MAFAAVADPERFEEAIAWFRSQFPVTGELLNELGSFAGPRAWTVAGVTELDVLTDVHKAIDKAIEQGTSFEDFRRDVKAKLFAQWGKKDSARLETVFRTNVQQSYNRGRWVQMTDPDVVALRPFWMYDAVLDSRSSKICPPRDGITRPHDDPYWKANYPPLHHRCRGSVRTLTERQAKKQKKKPVPEVEPSKGFGASPDEAAEWRPDKAKYPADLWNRFEKKHAKRRKEAA
jgi:SPP1 gp7 family putative phage head morphogenesis protein